MTTPNAFTRSTLVGVAGHMTHALADLGAVLPHMRAVAAAATGARQATALKAVEQAEAIEQALRTLDSQAEAAKTLFRCATTLSGEEPAPPTHTCPPALLGLMHDGPAALPGGGAALVQRQV